MAFTLLQAEGINLADTFAFTGTVSGAGMSNLTPAFQASVGSGGQAISDNSYVKIQFSVEQYDSDGTYDASTNYRWTPAESGRFFIFSGLTVIPDASGKFGVSVGAFYKNGSMFQESKIDTRRSDNTSTGSMHFHSLTSIVDSDADDYWEVYVKSNNESGNDNSVRGHGSEVLSWFGGYKIA